jgi:hypothetical protein
VGALGKAMDLNKRSQGQHNTLFASLQYRAFSGAL